MSNANDWLCDFGSMLLNLNRTMSPAVESVRKKRSVGKDGAGQRLRRRALRRTDGDGPGLPRILSASVSSKKRISPEFLPTCRLNASFSRAFSVGRACKQPVRGWGQPCERPPLATRQRD